ncbi:MAG: hypothetical protein CVU89_10095 [Firmicutes bacterium HGW-Firmicutes-14]|nr:MAG: hypothetical protein CVU89_10095 [Firmicutes bacterium HGW-Firmicutes-14]
MTEGKGFSYHRSKLMSTGKMIQECFSKNEGLILEDSAVVSRFFQVEPRDCEGVVHIYPARDAGVTYMKMLEKNNIVHIDVFHNPADINVFDLANRINSAIFRYLDIIEEEDMKTPVEKEVLGLNLAQRIFVKTASGEGPVIKPLRVPGPPGGTLYSHVHILAKLPVKYFGLIYCIVGQVQKAVTYQGICLRPVRKIIHIYEEESAGENFPLGVPVVPDSSAPPELKFQNSSQALFSIARQLGGMEIAEMFLDMISPLKTFNLMLFSKKHPCAGKILLDLEELKFIQRERLGCSLTPKGQELRRFLRTHRKELEAMMRKAIRRIPPTAGISPSGRFCRVKPRPGILYEKKKTEDRRLNNRHAPVAITETVIRAATRRLIEGNRNFSIKESDLAVFRRKSKTPVDICMVVDLSGSMRGDKFNAVQWTAEYLILTTRDRVALVTFQERDARVTVPFTRSYASLHKGLLTLQPEGLTPLAQGLRTASDLIRKSRPKNPLLALITDGRPNVPLFTTDPVADAVKVCTGFPGNKIRFIIIGIDPSEEFIPHLAKAGGGNYYLVDDIDRSNLISIMRNEIKPLIIKK